MAAKRSLADAAKDQPPPRRFPTWDEKLRQKNPQRMEEIDGWISEWEGGKCRELFATANALALFIAKNSEGFVQNAPPVLKYMQRRTDGKPRRSK